MRRLLACPSKAERRTSIPSTRRPILHAAYAPILDRAVPTNRGIDQLFLEGNMKSRLCRKPALSLVLGGTSIFTSSWTCTGSSLRKQNETDMLKIRSVSSRGDVLRRGSRSVKRHQFANRWNVR